MSSTSTDTTSGEVSGSRQSPVGRKVARRWPLAAAFLWAAVIFATSCTWISRDIFVAWIWALLPGDGVRQWFAGFWDGGGGLVVVKGYHMAEYALLFLLGRAALIRMGAGSHRGAWAAAVLAIAYAASDEWHQTFVPGRGGTFHDVLIDTAGVCLAALIARRRTRVSLEQT